MGLLTSIEMTTL